MHIPDGGESMGKPGGSAALRGGGAGVQGVEREARLSILRPARQQQLRLETAKRRSQERHCPVPFQLCRALPGL